MSALFERDELFEGLADLVVEFRQLNFYFLPLEEMILGLLAHWGDEIKLSGH